MKHFSISMKFIVREICSLKLLHKVLDPAERGKHLGCNMCPPPIVQSPLVPHVPCHLQQYVIKVDKKSAYNTYIMEPASGGVPGLLLRA